MAKQAIAPANVHRARGYSHAIKAGNTVYVAGQIGLDESGNVVGKDIVTQIAQAYENMKRVLEASGARMTDIVKLNFYCLNAEDLRQTGDVRKKYFGDHKPASTAVTVSKLGVPGTIVEVEAIAVID
ncbi:MAG: RidA family protein [Dehalococcoidia bacterium]|nr:RidA family protein [Dehalococcoidia bacterium]